MKFTWRDKLAVLDDWLWHLQEGSLTCLGLSIFIVPAAGITLFMILVVVLCIMAALGMVGLVADIIDVVPYMAVAVLFVYVLLLGLGGFYTPVIRYMVIKPLYRKQRVVFSNYGSEQEKADCGVRRSGCLMRYDRKKFCGSCHYDVYVCPTCGREHNVCLNPVGDFF